MFIPYPFVIWMIGLPFIESFQSISFVSSASRFSTRSSAAHPPTLTESAPSWKALEETLLQTPTGSRLHQESIQREKGLGPPHVDARIRLFSDDAINHGNHTVRVTLYRDQSAWCPYCQKVWIFLEEKQIPYKIQTVPLNAYGDKPAWYSRSVNGGKLPAVELDGEFCVESMEIMALLENAFPNHGPAMIPPPGSDTRHTMDELLELERELQRDWFSLVFYPVEEQALVQANQTLVETLKKLDLALSNTDGPWFLGGNDPSLMDIVFIPLIERMLASVLYWKGFDIRSLDELVHLQTWLQAWERRASYLATRSDYYTLTMSIPSQNGPGYMIPGAKPIANQIAGLSGTWSLPLDLERCFEQFPAPDLTPAGSSNVNEAFDPCHEAAYKLVMNHESIALFACRGAGEAGRPAFHAELADPYAEPNEEFLPAVHVCLRHVAHALLHGWDTPSVQQGAVQDLMSKGGDNELRPGWTAYPDPNDNTVTYFWNEETGDSVWTSPTQQLDTCLAYLRDRVGVPRDMGPAAAMQLCAHLNWAIGVLMG